MGERLVPMVVTYQLVLEAHEDTADICLVHEFMPVSRRRSKVQALAWKREEALIAVALVSRQ